MPASASSDPATSTPAASARASSSVISSSRAATGAPASGSTTVSTVTTSVRSSAAVARAPRPRRRRQQRPRARRRPRRPHATPSTGAPRWRRRRWRPQRPPRPRVPPRVRAGRSCVVSSTSDAARRAASSRGVDVRSGVAVGSAASARSPPSCGRARSAAVVSVVRDAATRCACRLVVAAAAARLRAAGVPDAAVERAALADFAASPRALDAFDDAAREAAVRFDRAVSSGWSGVGGRRAWRLPWRWTRPWLRCCAVRGACVRAWRRSRHPTRRIRRRRPSTRRSRFADADVAPDDFVVAGFVAPDLGVRGFGAAFGAAASSAGVLEADAGAVLPGRFAEPRGARGAVDDPRTADTPVPVPSGASSSKSERETEVTQTTYQSRPSEPSCDVARRRGSCAFPERRITIPLRPPTLLGVWRGRPISCNPA